jgi:hypothetical protein
MNHRITFLTAFVFTSASYSMIKENNNPMPDINWYEKAEFSILDHDSKGFKEAFKHITDEEQKSKILRTYIKLRGTTAQDNDNSTSTIVQDNFAINTAYHLVSNCYPESKEGSYLGLIKESEKYPLAKKAQAPLIKQNSLSSLKNLKENAEIKKKSPREKKSLTKSLSLHSLTRFFTGQSNKKNVKE